MWNDLAHRARAVRRTPVASAVIVATLSFGIAATTVSFSLINGLFIRPLPIERGGGPGARARSAGAGL